MNKLKFMDAPIDEFTHTEAHTAVGAQRMSQEAYFNWAYLMYDWGFPPEIAEEDWEDFRKAVSTYQDHGIKVFGYIQASNCVYEGSYKVKDWYAKDPKGRLIHYYTGRYMTCWLNSEWRYHLEEMIDGVIEAGANGVFFDNPWLGIQPLHFGSTWSGPAGCYCSLCNAAFHGDTGYTIPTNIHPETDQASRIYLAWRSNLVTQTLCSLANYARSKKTDIVVSVNDYDTVMHPTYISHGIDLPGLARCQDLVMIEDFALPRFHSDLFVNNAITIRTALALVGETPLSTNPYDKGIGFDAVFSPRRFQQGIAEAAACGTVMVVKGTEFVEPDGTFTLLSAKKYSHQRLAIGQIQTWLADKTDLYRDRLNIAKIGLLYPENNFKNFWDRTAKIFFGVCQVLTLNGFPWRVVTQDDSWAGLELIFTFEKTDNHESDVLRVNIPDLLGWCYPKMPHLTRFPTIQSGITKVLTYFYRAYFDHVWARNLIDTLGLPQWFLGSPHFKIPKEEVQLAIIAHVERVSDIMVQGSNAPVLIEHWKQRNQNQVHLVNYGSSEQPITVTFQAEVIGEVISPTRKDWNFSNKILNFDIDLYAIITYINLESD